MQTAAKRAKFLGANNLKQVALIYGCTRQDLQYHFKNNPFKFDIIVLGSVEFLRRQRITDIHALRENSHRDKMKKIKEFSIAQNDAVLYYPN